MWPLAGLHLRGPSGISALLNSLFKVSMALASNKPKPSPRSALRRISLSFSIRIVVVSIRSSDSVRTGKRDAGKYENAHSPVVLNFSSLWHLIT